MILKKTLIICILCSFFIGAKAQNDTIKIAKKMIKVEIWSDIMCPFCYIGKKKFDAALNTFSEKENVEIEWHSFLLDPDIASGTGKNYAKHLSDKKGMSLSDVKNMFEGVQQMGASAGVLLDFDKAIVANSLDAHRLTHLAAQYGKKSVAKEALFKAHFTDGQDIGSHEVLVQIGEKIGLPKNEIQKMLASDLYKDTVKNDIDEAATFGINSVPFFVFNRQFAVSGAQDASVFLQALERCKN
jgi:predicted DsbA family dithiol-disulfide isomerase